MVLCQLAHSQRSLFQRPRRTMKQVVGTGSSRTWISEWFIQMDLLRTSTWYFGASRSSSETKTVLKNVEVKSCLFPHTEGFNSSTNMQRKACILFAGPCNCVGGSETATTTILIVFISQSRRQGESAATEGWLDPPLPRHCFWPHCASQVCISFIIFVFVFESVFELNF